MWVERDGWGGNHKYFYFINISNEPLNDLEDVFFTPRNIAQPEPGHTKD